MNKVNVYATLAERIITLLDRDSEIRVAELLNTLDEDPAMIKFVLGFLLKFRLIEYDRHNEIIKLSEPLRLIIESQ